MDHQRKIITIVAVGILSVIGLVFAVAYTSSDTSEGVQTPVNNPAEVRQALRNEDLTDDQRRELVQTMQQVRQERMGDRLREYFAVSKEQQVAVLDRHINEMQQRRTEAEQRRSENGEQPRESDRAKRMGSRTPDDRRQRSESISAEQKSQMMEYGAAMRARMMERGISNQGGPGFGGRGFGGRQ